MPTRLDAVEHGAHQGLWRGGAFVGVGDAQAAPEVQVLQWVSLRFDGLDEIQHPVQGIEVGADLGDL